MKKRQKTPTELFDIDAFLKESEVARDQFPYDTASSHYESENYPKDLPPSAARTHIGMYLGWAIETGLVSDNLSNQSGEMITKFLKGEIMPSEILRLYCNDELTKDHLNAQGNAFTKQYYWVGWKYSYSKDYDQLAGWPDVSCCFYLNDTNENYKLVKAMLDKRYAEWKQEQNL